MWIVINNIVIIDGYIMWDMCFLYNKVIVFYYSFIFGESGMNNNCIFMDGIIIIYMGDGIIICIFKILWSSSNYSFVINGIFVIDVCVVYNVGVGYNYIIIIYFYIFINVGKWVNSYVFFDFCRWVYIS